MLSTATGTLVSSCTASDPLTEATQALDTFDPTDPDPNPDPDPSEPDGDPTASAVARLDAVTDRGSSGGRHYFELWGDFPGLGYTVRMVCNGVDVPTRREYQGARQINVSIADQPSGTACSFRVEHPEGPSAALPPRTLLAPSIEIAGINDRGTTNGKRYFELYGKLDATAQSARVICNGATLPTTVTYPGTGQPGNSQINVAVSSFPTSDWTCSFEVLGQRAGINQVSPPFHRQAATSRQMHGRFGAYHWGNNRVTAGASQIGLGAAHIRAAGFSTIRLVMSPNVRGNLVQGTRASLPYQFDQDAFRCTDKRFLACAATSPEYTAVMADANVRTIMLTAYDSVAMGDRGELDGMTDPAFLVTNGNQVIEEFRQLGYELQRRYANTGKTIIVAHWEGDNHVYCGSTYRWVTDSGFRATCPIETVERRSVGFRYWLHLRQLGLRAGIAAARDAGYSGVTVGDGIEFSFFKLVPDGPSLFRDAIPALRPSFASYSSYDTINKLVNGGKDCPENLSPAACVASELREIKRELAMNAPGTQLVLGEAGFNVDTKEQQIPATATMALLVHAADIATTILWSGYDSTPACTSGTGVCRSIVDGFFDQGGTERWILKNLRNATVGLPPHAPIRIEVATISKEPDGSVIAHAFGTFPGGSDPSTFRYAARTHCTSGLADATVIYQSSGLIQVRLTRTGSSTEMACQLAVYRQGVMTRDDDYTQSPLSQQMTWTFD